MNLHKFYNCFCLPAVTPIVLRMTTISRVRARLEPKRTHKDTLVVPEFPSEICADEDTKLNVAPSGYNIMCLL